MTSNNEADRKNLPAPKGPRFSASSSKYIAPRTDTERVLADALIEVMKIERASIEDNFFQDLGAHSLLMARFGAEIRKRMKIAAVSMRDIYLNPTLEKLAHHIDSLPKEAPGGVERTSNREAFHIPSDFAYYDCGTLQGAWYMAWSAIGLWMLVAGIQWTYAAMPDLGQTYLRILEYSIGLFLLFSLLPIAIKWVVIGKWKPEVIPVWSFRYFRFWCVRSLLGMSPMAWFDGPVYNLYLQLLGAKVGRNTVIHAGVMPVCAT